MRVGRYVRGCRRRRDRRRATLAQEASGSLNSWHLRRKPLAFSPRRDQVSAAGRPRRGAAARGEAAGIRSPIDEIDAARVRPVLWFEPMWFGGVWDLPARARARLTEAGELRSAVGYPVNPSGGVLSANPIGGPDRSPRPRSSHGQAEARQKVPGARKARGHAYGGSSQYFCNGGGRLQRANERAAA